MTTYSVWMEIPTQDHKMPFSRIAGGLTEDEAEVYRRTLYFNAQVTTEQED